MTPDLKDRHLTLDIHKLFKILDHRNDAVLHNNGHSLRTLAEKSASQSSLMLSMAELARYDSRTMRIVSFIALIYLPVNLVSVSGKSAGGKHRWDHRILAMLTRFHPQTFFSSNIVQLATRDIVNPVVELQKEVGLFVGVTVLLTVLTVAGTMYWEYRERLATPLDSKRGFLARDP